MKKQLLVLTVSAVYAASVLAGAGHGNNEHGGHGGAHGNKQGHDMTAMGAHKSTVGEPAKTSEATKRIKVSLTDDMKIVFSEDLDTIKSGTIIQFIVKNDGRINHEMSISSEEEQLAHAEMMRQMPDMKHEEGNTVSVEPGKIKFFTWRFEGDGTVIFSCNIPGHYEAGMHRKANLIN